MTTVPPPPPQAIILKTRRMMIYCHAKLLIVDDEVRAWPEPLPALPSGTLLEPLAGVTCTLLANCLVVIASRWHGRIGERQSDARNPETCKHDTRPETDTKYSD